MKLHIQGPFWKSINEHEVHLPPPPPGWFKHVCQWHVFMCTPACPNYAHVLWSPLNFLQTLLPERRQTDHRSAVHCKHNGNLKSTTLVGTPYWVFKWRHLQAMKICGSLTTFQAKIVIYFSNTTLPYTVHVLFKKTTFQIIRLENSLQISV